jgi:hypothetical protein
MDQSLPADQVIVHLWRADAVVLFDWLMRTDLNTVPIEHPAEKQALADLLTRLEVDTNVRSVKPKSNNSRDSELV